MTRVDALLVELRRIAAALELLAERDVKPENIPQRTSIPVSETDIARAKRNARKLGLVVHEKRVRARSVTPTAPPKTAPADRDPKPDNVLLELERRAERRARVVAEFLYEE